MGSRIFRDLTAASGSLVTARTRRQRVALAASLFLLLALGGLAIGQRFMGTNATGKSSSQPTRRSAGTNPPIPASAALLSAATQAVGLTNTGCGDPLFGSGFAVAYGYIVTSAHVVAGAHDRLVVAHNGRTTSATVVLFDPELDVAGVRAPGLDLGGIPRGKASAGASTSLSTLQGALRRPPDGLPAVSTFTIWCVLHDAGCTWSRDRS